ncbi:hypothetical protein F442_20779 [Phytophthora nicotianae P10297]|uniref:Reverse transcriptase n=1 Tax=Phytophthora nicotianae P10297 TaxID=1317064 RepID=W2Y544_PHYNI|nr:hypothetical protein F442_20779 [Phytophthora nicotianae P10297]
MAEDEQICYHEGGDLYAQVIGDGMAVIPEVLPTTEEVKIEDIHLVPDASLPVEVEKLRQEIWNSRHLPIRKALSPAARGLSDLIKELQRAEIISFLTSLWTFSIVIIVKKNGVDIRLCILITDWFIV